MKITTHKLDSIYDSHCVAILRLLKENNKHFFILCDMKKVQFNPTLSQEIMDKFENFGQFVLAGYTFESLEISSTRISFEAGFSADNEASLVEVLISGIYQIITEDIQNYKIPLFTRVDSELVFENDVINDETKLNQEEQDSIDKILSNANNLEILNQLKSPKK